MDTRFKPYPGDFGCIFVEESRSGIGSGAIANSSTTVFNIVTMPRKSLLDSISTVAHVVPTSAGTLLVTFNKLPAAGGAAVPLSTPVAGSAGAKGDLLTLTADVGIKQTNLVSGDATKIFQAGDTLQASVVASSTLSGQPTDLTFSAMFKLLGDLA